MPNVNKFWPTLLELSKNKDEVLNILRHGSAAAKDVAATTLAEVKSAIGINYF